MRYLLLICLMPIASAVNAQSIVISGSRQSIVISGQAANAVNTAHDAKEAAAAVPSIDDAPAPTKMVTQTQLYVTYAPFHCPPCDQLRRDAAAGKFGAIRIVEAPAWDGIKGYPSVRWQDGDGNWLSVAKYDDSVRLFLISQVTRVPTITKPANSSNTIVEQSQTSREISAVSMQWNIDGDWSPTVSQTSSHLQKTHGVSTDGMTHQQMLDLHDSIHNGTGSQSSSCPSGNCPTQSTTRRRGRLGGLFRW